MPPAPSRQSPAKSPLAPTVPARGRRRRAGLMEAVAAAPSAAPPPPRPPPPVRTEPPNERTAAAPAVAAADQVAERAVARPMSPPPLHTEPTSDDFPPKTGIRMPLLFEPPGLAPHDDDQPVLLAPPRDESYEEALLQARLDEEAVADTVRRVVFDSETSPLPRAAAARLGGGAVGGGGLGARRRRRRAAAAGGRAVSEHAALRVAVRVTAARRRWARTRTSWCCAPTCRPSRTRGGSTSSLRARRRAGTYTFSIVNFSMGDCLYSSGLRPLLWSSAARGARHRMAPLRRRPVVLSERAAAARRRGSTHHTLRFSLARNSTATAAASPAACCTRSRRSATTFRCCATCRRRTPFPRAPPHPRRRLRAYACGNACDVPTISEFAPPGADADEAAAKMARRRRPLSWRASTRARRERAG